MDIYIQWFDEKFFPPDDLVKTYPVRSKIGLNDMEGPGGSSDSVTLKFSSSGTVDLRETH